MQINSDFRDLLRNLNEAGARYLIVGGYAAMIHTEPRYTKDLDVWVDPTPGNAAAVFQVAGGIRRKPRRRPSGN